jgi:apolipoprotein N-acyltransferase
MTTESPCMDNQSAPETGITAKVTVHTAPAPAPIAPSQPTALLYLASLLSGVLLWACFHPLSWGAYLGWVALVPFLVLVRSQARTRTVYVCAWVAGLAFFVPVLQWMRYADWRMNATWILLAVYCSLYFPLALWSIRFLDRRRVPLVFSVPLVWVGLEYFRSFFMTGFAWYFLAHTQHDVLPMIQVTDLGGVYMVSLLVAAVNAFLFDILYQQPEVKQWFLQAELEPMREYASLDMLNRSGLADCHFRRNMILEGFALVFLLIGAYSYGVYRLGQDDFAEGPTVCLLQSNLDQRIRNDAAEQNNAGQQVASHFSELCVQASKRRPDLIIWPETSYPGEWVEVSMKYPIENVPAEWRAAELMMRDRLGLMAGQYTRIPHLLGMNSNLLDEHGKHRRYNSALLLNAKGRVEGKFDKMHRVPFGEYVPFKDWLPFMSALAPYDFDYSIQQGEAFTRFKVKDKYHFGVLVCFEDSDPMLARRYAVADTDGPAVDFLVNISNDGWFDGSSEHEAHLAVSRFRAIECRRAMVRAVNMGVSAVIDPNGRVLKPTAIKGTKPTEWIVKKEQMRYPDLPEGEWNQFKQVSGIIEATVPIDRRESLYVVAGDWMPMSCWGAFLGVGGWTWMRRRRDACSPTAKG